LQTQKMKFSFWKESFSIEGTNIPFGGAGTTAIRTCFKDLRMAPGIEGLQGNRQWTSPNS
jgi:hypothetical protein